MAKKTETKTEKVEREYVIPLREKCRPVPRYKKTPKAIKTVKEFVAKHMKIRDRDLNKVKLDKFVNETLWSRGIKNPLHKIKVKVTKVSDDEVKVELVDFSKKLKAKKDREEKAMKAAEAIASKKKAEADAKTTEEKAKEEDSEGEKEKNKAEEKEKKSSVIESGKEMEKIAAKKMKHQVGGKTNQPKHQQRKALAK